MTIDTLPLPPENVAGRVLLRHADWHTYQDLLRANGDGPVRITYDRGRLEIEVPSLEHERLKGFIGQLIEYYALAARSLSFRPGAPHGSVRCLIGDWRRMNAITSSIILT